jgi:F-type H+-transporting ATPase subunit b
MLVAAASTASSDSSSNSIFLIPNGTIVVELVLFIIVFGIVAKFILPPLQKVMAERDATIRSALEASDEGKSEAERLESEALEVLAAARATARGALEEAGRIADEARQREQSRGREEHDRRILAAEALLAAEATRARAELSARLESVVVAAAERVVGVEVRAEQHRAAIDQAIATLAAANPSEVR